MSRGYSKKRDIFSFVKKILSYSKSQGINTKTFRHALPSTLGNIRLEKISTT